MKQREAQETADRVGKNEDKRFVNAKEAGQKVLKIENSLEFRHQKR